MFSNLFTKDVRLGINRDMCTDIRHGIVWVETSGGGVVQQPFVVDKPEYVVDPGRATMASLFTQVRKLGMRPTHIELLVGDVKRVFKDGVDSPVFVQAM